MSFYNFNSIELARRVQQHGHGVYLGAAYVKDDVRTPIIYKENKHNRAILSEFEVAFGELASLFLAKNLTPPSVLVKNDTGEILGVASEHITTTIARREGTGKTFFSLNQSKPYVYTGLHTVAAREIPYYFLDQFPSDFFHCLRRDEAAGIISLDLESLAQVLSCAYTLEEDDLHKGNLGFYVTQQASKPHVVFFKVDHDYMLVDSVMSHWRSRVGNCYYGANSFRVTSRDLANFPRLTDSHNYYWPTIKRPMLATGSKAYTSDDEIKAFASLASSPEFSCAKWGSFYRQVLIPPALIQQALSKHLNTDDPEYRAHLALITQAVITRQAKMRAVLFSIPSFRDFVSALSADERVRILESISSRAGTDAAAIAAEIGQSMERHRILCGSEHGFVIGDTPLHTAIRLQDYRYYDTWQEFGHFVEQPNSRGEKPLDIAVAMARKFPEPVANDLRCDFKCVMKHMLRQGAKTTTSYNRFSQETTMQLNNYLLHSTYPTRAGEKETVRDLKLLLRELGEDHRYSLKMQKELAVLSVREFIRNNRTNSALRTMLSTLKTELNGTATIPPAPELQFIRQLRSQLWIVRFFRGLLGGTTTQVQLYKLIDTEIKRLTPSCFSFFAGKKVSSEDAGRQERLLSGSSIASAPLDIL